jgi:hypothetical protein
MRLQRFQEIEHRPDVLLIEPFLENRDAIRWIKDLATEFPRIRILVVTRQSERTYACALGGNQVNYDKFATNEAFTPAYSAQIQQPINPDGSSVFSIKRGVVPVKFTLTANCNACALPPATIALTRTAGGTAGTVDESVYTGSADTGANFRIDGCQYVYNLSASALGPGTYRVAIVIGGIVVGSGTFALK